MAEKISSPRVILDGGVDGEQLVGFPSGVDSFSHPLLVKPEQVRWLENAVTQGAFIQTRPGNRERWFADDFARTNDFYSWWVSVGSPDLHPQMLEYFSPSTGPTQLVFALAGYIFYSLVNPDGSLVTPQLIPTIRFDPNATTITGTRCTQTATVISGMLTNNIEPRNLLVIQDGINRAAVWDGFSAQTMNPEKRVTEDADGNTLYDDGWNETHIGLWCAWSGNRLFVFNGRVGWASDLGDPTHFTEELTLTKYPQFSFPENVTGCIDRGTSGTTRSQLVVCTLHTTHVIWSGVQDRSTWISTDDFVATIFSGAGCVAGKSMVLHRGLLYWKSLGGIVLFDSTGTVNSTQNLPVIDQEMAYSKRLESTTVIQDGDPTCGGVRNNYVFWAVPTGPTYHGRPYNAHVQVLDRQTTVVRSVGQDGPFSYGTTGWQGVWTGIRPVAFTNAPMGDSVRTYALSRDNDGVVRIWEMFQGNRADNGRHIPWLVETRHHRISRSVFDYANFRHFRVILDQIYGNLNMRGYWRGLRGKYHELLDKNINAAPGSILLNIDRYLPLTNNTLNDSFQSQSRTVISPNAGTTAGGCQSVGVESEYDDTRDHAFSLLFRFTGRGALTSYRLAVDQTTDDPEGRSNTDRSTGVDESGLNVVPSAGCPEHLPDTPAQYTLADEPDSHAFYPYESPVDPTEPYSSPPLPITVTPEPPAP